MAEHTSGKNKKTLIAVAIVAASVAAYTLIGSNQDITVIQNTESSVTYDRIEPLTVADAWQEEAADALIESKQDKNQAPANNPEKTNGYSLDYSVIHEEIGKIRLTENGDVVIDDIALRALRKAFPSHQLNHSPEMMAELIEIIKAGLPGPAGEQAADIVNKFFEYAKSQRELANIYGDTKYNTGDQQEAFNQTKALREMHFGEEVANQLFGKEEKETKFIADTFEITTNKTLTDEEKAQAKIQLKNDYVSSVINNWESRHQAYKDALNSLTNESQLEDQELKQALMELQLEHFSIEELRTIHKANVEL